MFSNKRALNLDFKRQAEERDLRNLTEMMCNFSYEVHTSDPKITPELYIYIVDRASKPRVQRVTSAPMLT